MRKLKAIGAAFGIVLFTMIPAILATLNLALGLGSVERMKAHAAEGAGPRPETEMVGHYEVDSRTGEELVRVRQVVVVRK